MGSELPVGDADRAPRGTVTCSSVKGDEGAGGTDPLQHGALALPHQPL